MKPTYFPLAVASVFDCKLRKMNSTYFIRGTSIFSGSQWSCLFSVGLHQYIFTEFCGAHQSTMLGSALSRA